MVTTLPTKQALRRVLSDLMRRPRTVEVRDAINKVKDQIRACPQ